MLVLSNYPLSRAFKQRLEQSYGSALRLINVAELRQVSFMNLLTHLRAITAPCLSVATEDEASTALLPILELMAALTRAKHLQTLDSGLNVKPFSRSRAAWHALRLAVESVRAAGDLLVSQWQLRRLERQPRRVAFGTVKG